MKYIATDSMDLCHIYSLVIHNSSCIYYSILKSSFMPPFKLDLTSVSSRVIIIHSLPWTMYHYMAVHTVISFESSHSYYNVSCHFPSDFFSRTDITHAYTCTILFLSKHFPAPTIFHVPLFFQLFEELFYLSPTEVPHLCSTFKISSFLPSTCISAFYSDPFLPFM